MQDNDEQWEDVKGYEGIYKVSNRGRVKSLKFGKDKLLKATKANTGYCVVLSVGKGISKRFMLARLMQDAFVGHKMHNYKLELTINDGIHSLKVVEKKNSNSGGKFGTTKMGKKWNSYACIDGKTLHLGVFKTEALAYSEYKEYLREIKEYKSFKALNKIFNL